MIFLFNSSKEKKDKVIDVNDMDNLLGKVELIDIREEYEFKGGSLKSAKNIPMGKLLENPEKYLDKDKEYYLLCRSGARSENACSVLMKEGYKVINVKGGVINYLGTNKG